MQEPDLCSTYLYLKPIEIPLPPEKAMIGTGTNVRAPRTKRWMGLRFWYTVSSQLEGQ